MAGLLGYDLEYEDICALMERDCFTQEKLRRWQYRA